MILTAWFLAAALAGSRQDARAIVDALIDADRGKVFDSVIQDGLPVPNSYFSRTWRKMSWESSDRLDRAGGGCNPSQVGGYCGRYYKYSIPACVLTVTLRADNTVSGHGWKGSAKSCGKLADELLVRRGDLRLALDKQQIRLMGLVGGYDAAPLKLLGAAESVPAVNGSVLRWRWTPEPPGACLLAVALDSTGHVTDVRLDGTSYGCSARLEALIKAPNKGVDHETLDQGRS